MPWWTDRVLPRIIDKALDTKEIPPLRERTCQGLRGDVVEIGFGSGLNIPHYPAAVRSVNAVEPSDVAWRLARKRLDASSTPVRRSGLDGERLDLPDESFDAVYLPLIVTVAPDGQRILAEAARVAKPGVRLVVLDRFWPEGRPRPAAVRRAGALLGSLAMHIDRRFSEIHAGAPDLRVLDDETLAPGGFLQLITLEKSS